MPLGYQELEPYYDMFDKICGTSGQGRKSQGREAGRRQSVRRAAQHALSDAAAPDDLGPKLFEQAAASMGFHPFPHPAGNLSQAYTNPLGMQLGKCTFCGFCEKFGCGNYSKASPQTT